MKMIIDILVIAVASFAAYLVYMVAERAFRNFGGFNSPKLIAGIVAILTLLAIVDLGKGVVMLLLIPYAALGITLVALCLLSFLANQQNTRFMRTVAGNCRAFGRLAQAWVRRIRKEMDNFWQR